MDIFDEVAEDLRHDQAVQLAKRYGAWLLAACLLGAGRRRRAAGRQNCGRGRQAVKAAQQYLALTQSIDDPSLQLQPAQAGQAAAALNHFAAAAPEGYKTLADLRAAALYAASGQVQNAEALWTGVAEDGAADPLLRDLATLLWAQHALGTAPDADVLERLQPLALNGNPYHALAREAQALAYLHEGNDAQAKALFTQIVSDPDLPENLRNRDQALLASLNG